VIGDGVEAPGALQEGEIVGDETEAQKKGAEATGEFAARVQITGVRTEAEGVGEHGQR
jgi:hypothetical protein